MQINQYANEAFQINDEDFYDVDYWTGTAFESRKISGATLKSILANPTAWGDITGTLSDQTDLQNALDAKQDEITLTTTGTSGPATLTGSTLNIPDYTSGNGDMLKSVYDPQDEGIVIAAKKELVSFVNKTGSTVTEGTIVYLKTSSTSGTHPEIELADASTEATSSKTIGAVFETTLNDEVGYIVTSGEVDNLDTSAYTIGTRLWLSTTPGQVTTTPPTSPDHAVFIGTVTRSQNGNGRILYAIQNGYELGEIHDVLLTSPQDGEFLTYDATAGLWKNTPAASSTQIELDPVIDLLNTPPASPTDGDRYRIGTAPTGVWVGKNNQLAEWDAGTSAWVYTVPVTDNIVFQTATSTTFRYNGSGWVQWAGTPILQNGNTLGNVVKFGTTDNFNVEVVRNNVRRFIFGANGFYFVKTNVGLSLVASAYFNGVFLTDNRTLNIPDKDGTLATLDDLTKVTIRTSTINTTLQLGDAGNMIEMNLAAANNLTIPTFAGVQLPVGTVILISQYGAGQTTIVPSVGVTLRSNGGKTKLAGQYSQASLTKRATDEWYLSGDITL
jgi:hypothetical protein